MLLFLMGIDLVTMVLVVLLLLLVGRIIFWLTNTPLRKVLKNWSTEKIKLLSVITAFFLSPVIVFGLFALIFFTQTSPVEPDENIEETHYKIMSEDIRADLKLGMTKTEVTRIFGEADTTHSIVTYDLSLPNAKDKYVLEILFDTTGLKDYARQQ